MSVHITQVADAGRSFTLLAEQDVPVTAEEFDRVIGRAREAGEWFGVELTWPTSPDVVLEVGSALEFKAPVGPFALDFILIVADRAPGESLLFRSTRGIVDLTAEYTWEPTDTGITVRMRVHFRVRGALWWKRPWIRAVARQSIVRGMRRMRQDLASQPLSAAVAQPAPSSQDGRVRAFQVPARSRPVAAHRKVQGRRRAHQA